MELGAPDLAWQTGFLDPWSCGEAMRSGSGAEEEPSGASDVENCDVLRLGPGLPVARTLPLARFWVGAHLVGAPPDDRPLGRSPRREHAQ